ncbi:SPFH domain-containing protein [Streptomyces rapamycinicus]|uniref:Flotillin n=1 Tax=Streptomyces rapamycinicus (strain ATCC 29253 / DSM 41530 / NRRL 5491 / AYB-994) TaxID=1343740 RepID=A0A3L8RM79_STRRN|nr:flotillin family protein [Streptomyces rapamycinicus]RLV80529.1 flotillin [Streptomyces rapamycinicus NRRL 5491]UTO64338.1 flotillin [Streptomyces rapamycinicus]UTP32294.1 flotillin [Streptomyces rapamycinicus NRRL 5491]
MFGYRVPAPDQAMLISGGRRGQGGAPFRVVTGHGKFVLPVIRKVRFLTLAMCEAEVAEKCVSRQGITLTVRAVIAFKVGNDTESIVNAGQRFLSDQEQMAVLTGRIFAGHLRAIIGSMTVEELITERQKLATEVLDTSKAEMAKIGLIVDSLQIQSIDDGDTGYIDAMSAPHKAAIQRQAQIAQAQASQASAEAEQEAARNQAEYARQTAVVQAQYNAEVDRAQAQAAQAGPLAEAHAQQEVLSARTELAQRAADLRQQQLVAEIVKPAEAEAERIRVVALAEAERMKIQAEAAASHGRVALDRMLIDQLPQIVKEAASGLSGANVNVLNGADGLGEIAAGLVGQGLTILDAVRRNMGAPGTEDEPKRRSGTDDGAVEVR